ncbi:MAG: type II toxin-antitoxin system HicB family antitoxin [Roseitalea sp.]|jgi:predicted RNase H-like HicB family nuclease|nr:type II toxin-antitoxin system HicB family antitoxin [Roseitalea sp.]MBO6724015.1 type II toxin-antitoxin system HicB family antitoxin [Roseitalea sp.]MBO6741807.1 type II toxin-antitoxin system HicB family antitoxin [Roseitalea sp.]
MKTAYKTLYLGLVEKDVGSAYGVTFPDLPGCFSAADTEDDLLPNAMEALEIFFEGNTGRHAPSTIEELMAKPEIAEALGHGAFFLTVPYILNNGGTTRVNITINRGLLRSVDAEAERRKMTRSAFLAQAAEREILG